MCQNKFKNVTELVSIVYSSMIFKQNQAYSCISQVLLTDYLLNRWI